MDSSTEIDQIAQAIISVQASLINPPYNATATVKTRDGIYSYEYTKLDLLCDMLRPQLEKYELAVIHTLKIEEHILTVTSTIIHASGQYIDSTIMFNVAKAAMTQVGSAMTYARRYALAALFGFASSDQEESFYIDDPEPEKTPAPAKSKAPTIKEIKAVKEKIAAITDIKELREYYKTLDDSNRILVDKDFSERSKLLDKEATNGKG